MALTYYSSLIKADAVLTGWRKHTTMWGSFIPGKIHHKHEVGTA